MTASDNTIRMYSQKTNPTITILKFLVYKIETDIVKPKMFTRFNFKTKPYSQALWIYEVRYQEVFYNYWKILDF